VASLNGSRGLANDMQGIITAAIKAAHYSTKNKRNFLKVVRYKNLPINKILTPPIGPITMPGPGMY
jgi:hypothetical protein